MFKFAWLLLTKFTVKAILKCSHEISFKEKELVGNLNLLLYPSVSCHLLGILMHSSRTGIISAINRPGLCFPTLIHLLSLLSFSTRIFPPGPLADHSSWSYPWDVTGIRFRRSCYQGKFICYYKLNCSKTIYTLFHTIFLYFSDSFYIYIFCFSDFYWTTFNFVTHNLPRLSQSDLLHHMFIILAHNLSKSTIADNYWQPSMSIFAVT